MTDVPSGASEAWLSVGARAALLTSDRVTFVTVEKIGKRDVVLSNGERVNVHTLAKRSSHAYGRSTYLLPPDDTAVVRAYSRQVVGNVRYETGTLLAEYERTLDPALLDRVRAQIDRLAPLGLGDPDAPAGAS